MPPRTMKLEIVELVGGPADGQRLGIAVPFLKQPGLRFEFAERTSPNRLHRYVQSAEDAACFVYAGDRVTRRRRTPNPKNGEQSAAAIREGTR